MDVGPDLDERPEVLPDLDERPEVLPDLDERPEVLPDMRFRYDPDILADEHRLRSNVMY
jgi:hypothetical protein